MSDIHFTVDMSELSAFIEQFGGNIPKANAYVLNLGGEKVLTHTREQIGNKFIVRVPSFLLPPARLRKHWKATSENPSVTITLGDATLSERDDIGSRRARILAKFERGGEKVAKDPARPIAIPTRNLRPSPKARVQKSMYPAALRLTERLDAGGQTLPKQERTLRGGGAVGRGKRGAFELDPAHMPGLGPRAHGIYQRFGPGRRDFVMIWAYRRRIPIPQRLNFHADAEALLKAFLLPRLEEEYMKRIEKGTAAA